MSAQIVYNGTGSGTRGNLFQGLKFCILQRVPLRPRWVELCEANGGKVVKLEKQADIVIADHARPNCPPGSISWKYIEESVKNGVLEDKEEHRAGPSTHTARDIASGQPAKLGRTAFTAEDDAELMKWVTQTERAGGLTKGNELYKQLEQKNPRHTWQSWQSRWVKKLIYQPRPQVYMHEEESEQDDNAEVPLAASSLLKGSHNTGLRSSFSNSPGPEHQIQETKVQGSARRNELETDKLKKDTSPKQSSNSIPWVQKSKGGTIFTEEDDETLLSEYDSIMNLADDEQFDAWAAWAMEYPNHTPQEWRNYFVKTLCPRVESRRATAQTGPVLPSKPKVDYSRITSTQPEYPASILSASSTKSYSVEENSSQDVVFDEITFEKLLTKFVDYWNPKPVDFFPRVCGKKISLFGLWQIVRDQHGGQKQVDDQHLWPHVAEKLHYGSAQISEASKELRACYDKVLMDFEQGYQEVVDDLSSSDSQAHNQIEAQLFPDAAHGDIVDHVAREQSEYEDQNLPSQPISTLPSRKRALDGLRGRETFNKRQRIDKGKGREMEIPSTPEDVINKNQKPRFIESSPLKNTIGLESPDLGSPVLGSSPIFRHSSNRDNFLKRQPTRRSLSPMSSTNGYKMASQNFDSSAVDIVDKESEVEKLTSSPALPPSNKPNGPTHERTPEEAHHEDSSTQSQTESEQEAEIGRFYDQCEAQGYEFKVITKAVFACGLQLAGALTILDDVQSGAGIPDDIEGVWTSEDDEALKDEGSPEYARILAKHGQEKITIRRKFLRG